MSPTPLYGDPHYEEGPFAIPDDVDPDDPGEFERWRHRIRPVVSVSHEVQAYVNHGRWIADCNYPECRGAEALAPRQSAFHCSNCHHIATVLWPGQAEKITEVLEARPVPQTRNWAPAGHRQSLASGHPEGQTLRDLIAENDDHEVI